MKSISFDALHLKTGEPFVVEGGSMKVITGMTVSRKKGNSPLENY